MTAAFPGLPERINDLGELASDLWWSWHYRARSLFRRSTTRSGGPPPTTRCACCGRCRRNGWRRSPATAPSWPSTTTPSATCGPPAPRAKPGGRRPTARRPAKIIAYFSAEFALHQSLPIYAGGLGVLAGDICKEASDLGLPFVGVGFMYPQGYFHQKVSAEGWQEETYERLDWADAPIEPAITPGGEHVHRRGPARHPHREGARCGTSGPDKVRLSCSTPTSRRTRRGTASCRRGSTAATRTCGSSRRSCSASAACARCTRMGIEPTVWHLNEGHAAFVAAAAHLGAGRAGRRPSTRRSRRCARPRCSPRTRRCRPATTRSRSSSWRPTWRARGAAWASTATGSWRSAPTTTGAARSST